LTVALALNIANDYAYVVNREAVRVYDRHGVPMGVVADAKRIGQGKHERAPSEGQYIGLTCDWRLPGSEVSQEIVPGCFITDSLGVAYGVLSVDPPGTYQGCYRCSCIALMVVGHTITWHLPANAPDAYGSPVIDQSGTLAPQSCAIQEVLCVPVLFQGVVSGFRRTYQIWLLGDVTLAVGATGVDEDGRVYTVQAVTTRNRLDELLCITAVVEP
jgi:hypothetical protein